MGFRIRSRMLFVFAVALVAVLSLSAGQASANHVQCGDTITQDTTLDSDLIDCPGDGIVIGADDITLDLRGHEVDGVSQGAGILNRGFNRTQIKNGTATGFTAGILIEGTSGQNEGAAENHVTNMVLVANTSSGMVLRGFGNGNEIEWNAAFRNGFSGIGLSDSFGTALISKNIAFENGTTLGGGGIFLGEAENARIEKNKAFHNFSGIRLDAPDNVVEHNTANENYDLGIEAVPGVTDGGGNKAFGNGNPLQCLNVVCK